MPVRIPYFVRSRQAWYYINLPEGLRDKNMLREWIWGYDITEEEKKAAYKVARRKYKDYAPEFWEEEEHGQESD